MSLDLENGLRVPLNEPAQFLQAGGSSGPEIRRIVIKQQICWHHNRCGTAPDFTRTGQQFIQVAEARWYGRAGGDIIFAVGSARGVPASGRELWPIRNIGFV